MVKIPSAKNVVKSIAMIAYVTKYSALDSGAGVDRECVEILEYDRRRIADWLDEKGFPGAAATLKKELNKLEKK